MSPLAEEMQKLDPSTSVTVEPNGPAAVSAFHPLASDGVAVEGVMVDRPPEATAGQRCLEITVAPSNMSMAVWMAIESYRDVSGPPGRSCPSSRRLMSTTPEVPGLGEPRSLRSCVALYSSRASMNA